MTWTSRKYAEGLLTPRGGAVVLEAGMHETHWNKTDMSVWSLFGPLDGIQDQSESSSGISYNTHTFLCGQHSDFNLF